MMKIIVTSCCKLQQIDPQPVWQQIMNESPDCLVLAGDNIYLNNDRHNDPQKLRSELRELYSKQLNEKYFAALHADLQQRGCTLLAIYDDHDFLGDNRYGGDHDPAIRDVAREELVRAFSVPRNGKDVYSVTHSDLVDVVVLDERYYRKNPLDSRGDRDAILGAAQWSWFENVVANSHTDYLVVISSSTIHRFIGECWEEYPGAFERMRVLMGHRKGGVTISGDVHRNALYDDSGVMEIVTSAVARNGTLFGATRENYGIFTFDEHGMHVELRSLKAGGRFVEYIALDKWWL